MKKLSHTGKKQFMYLRCNKKRGTTYELPTRGITSAEFHSGLINVVQSCNYVPEKHLINNDK